MIYITNKNNKSKHCFSENIKADNNIEASNFGIMENVNEKLNSATNWVDQKAGVNDLTKNVAIGSVAGAGIGGLGNLLIGSKKKSKMRRFLEGAGLGALAGGVAGGGYSLYDNLKDRESKLTDTLSRVSSLEEGLETEKQGRKSAEDSRNKAESSLKEAENRIQAQGKKLETERDSRKKAEDLLKETRARIQAQADKEKNHDAVISERDKALGDLARLRAGFDNGSLKTGDRFKVDRTFTPAQEREIQEKQAEIARLDAETDKRNQSAENIRKLMKEAGVTGKIDSAETDLPGFDIAVRRTNSKDLEALSQFNARVKDLSEYLGISPEAAANILIKNYGGK